MKLYAEHLLDEYLDFAETQASIARQLIFTAASRELLPRHKKDHTLVTDMDCKIETLIRNNIRSTFPKHGIIGEEAPNHLQHAEYQWVIDPIDGTQEFINGSPLYGFMLCLQHAGKPVVGIIDHPMLDLRCKAASGKGSFANGKAIRISHIPEFMQGTVMPARADFTKNGNEIDLFDRISGAFPNYRVFRSCYGHTCTLLGHTCITIEHDVHIWDIAATQILTEEAGGSFHILRRKSTADGDIFSVVFGEPDTVNRAVGLLAASYREQIPPQ